MDDLKVRHFIVSSEKLALERNIERGRLASVWMNKAIATKPELIADNLWSVSDREEQEALTKFLVEDGLISDEEWDFSYIEPQCIEHGVVHVFVCDGTRTLRVLCVHPISGKVEVC